METASLLTDLQNAFGAEAILSAPAANGLAVTVAPEKLLAFAQKLRDDPTLQFQQLMDVCGADYPKREKRFEVVYQFLSLSFNRRLTVKVPADEKTEVPSLTSLYKLAGWFERETYDMYGIRFAGHPDLRRLLTDYGFEGHPLRKDFPLWGQTEIRYDEATRRIVTEPVDLEQEYRDYENQSPWDEFPVHRKEGA